MNTGTGIVAGSRGSVLPIVLRGLLVVFFCGVNQAASAEFYQWIDEGGRIHVSNIPRRGVRADGTLRAAYDPNSIVYQHIQMRSSLRREGIAMERELERQRELGSDRAAAQAARHSARISAPRSNPPAVPAEGWMNLDELIQLEKRGGRVGAD